MSFLEKVSSSRRARVESARGREPLEKLCARCGRLPAARDACGMLAGWPRAVPAVIAEVKRRSPSAGALRPDAVPEEIAAAYARAGAFGISVLTEPDHFGGSLDDLDAVRRSVDLPVLYKDFVVDPYQVWEARSHGADLVLLMVALLGAETRAYVRLAREAGLEPLVEAHDEGELGAALDSGAVLVGINNRNLTTLEVDLGVGRELLPRVPPDVFAIAESGFREPGELEEFSALGARAFLIGGSLMGARDPQAALARLLGTGAA
jgi:indole-3-glycerol phosphate synthase